MLKILVIFQGSLQLFVALGALVSGAMLIAVPSGRLLQFPEDILRQMPFGNFLLPGIILFCINGAGQAVAGVMTLRRDERAGILGGIFGLGLMIWVFVQVNMIGGRDGLQYAYFSLGLIETTLAFFIDRCMRSGRAARAGN